MTLHKQNPCLIMALGIALGAGAMMLAPQESVKAAAANGNDKFSMTTVPITGGFADTEAIFVLDHLTGVIRGGVLNQQSGTFSHTYLYNVAGDFRLNPATPEPKYSIVGGPATLRAQGGNAPANGLLYVAELTSGAVLAYSFPAPRGRGAATPLPLARLDGFSFREAAGG